MSLQAPNLDSRTFADLVKEARDRIPRFTPEWTNLNDADPGMTLVKLQAWLTETLLYEVNRLPELNYIKFLQLLNVTPTAARAARTELQFKLKKLDGSNDPLTFFIPKNAQIQADDPDLETPVIFETETTLTALNAVVAAVLANNGAAAENQLTLVSSYDAKKAELSLNHSFYPLGESPQLDEYCLIGLLLRPFRKEGVDYSQTVFPAVELDLAVSAVEVFEDINEAEQLQGPLGMQCLLPYEVSSQQQALTWEIYTGSVNVSDFSSVDDESAWTRLNPAVDESAALSRSGHLRPVLPDNVSQVSFFKLSRDFWLELGLKKTPLTGAELIADLTDNDLNFTQDNIKDVPWDIIVPAASLEGVALACDDIPALVTLLGEINSDINSKLAVDAISREQWIDLDVGYSDPSVPEHAIAWLRVRVASVGEGAYQPALLNGFALNSVAATAAVTRVEETVGYSDGRPAQQFSLAKTPVYFDPQTRAADIKLEVVEAGQSSSWSLVSDFFAADSHDEVYRLDENSGVITFGDGVNGRIPVAGSSIIARRYRFGGGASSNVGANTVTKLKTSLPRIDSVVNLRAASGGADAETLEHAKLRAPHELRTRDRAVTADDFVFLSMQSPGVAVHAAYALARTALNTLDQSFEEKLGAVTVVILPANSEQETPQPSEAQLKAICAHLNSKRLITTELYVTGPRYAAINKLQVEIRAHRNADLQTIAAAIQTALVDYFHPLRGGDAGSGWPFGDDIYFGGVYDLLLQVEGVRTVACLNIELEGSLDSDCQDYLPLPDGYLPHLRRDAIDLKVIYDNR